MKEFFTRDKANEGIKFPLEHPDGTPSEHWLVVRGIDSDQFHIAERMKFGKLLPTGEKALKIKDPEERERFVHTEREREEIELLCVLIADWSFEKPCTFENVKKFLIEAPQIAVAIDKVAGERFRFFDQGLINSKDTQESNLKSASHQKAATLPKKRTSKKSGSKQARNRKG